MAKRVLLVELGESGARDYYANLCSLLIERGYEVTFYGPCDAAGLEKLRAHKIDHCRPLCCRTVEAARRKLQQPLMWLEGAVKVAARADIVLTVHHSPFVIGALAKLLKPRLHFIGYFQEMHAPVSYRRGASTVLTRDLARTMDMSISVNEHHLNIRRALFNIRCPSYPVWICPLHAYAGGEDLPRRAPGARLKLVYQGNIGHFAGIPQLVDAVGQCADVAELVLMGRVASDYDAQFREQLRQTPNAQYLGYFGWSEMDQMLDHTRQADVGVSLFPWRRPDITLYMMFPGSQKVFQYMSCGLPILASDNPTMTFVEQEGAGLCVQSERPEPVAEAIRRFATDRDLWRRTALRSRQLSREKYNLRVQAASFIEALVESCPP